MRAALGAPSDAYPGHEHSSQHHTAKLTGRHPAAGRRLKILVGVLAFLGLIATPIERDLLPAPLDDLSTQPAHAQSVGEIVAGMPSLDCEDPQPDTDPDHGYSIDANDPAICYLTEPACPKSPINQDVRLTLHAEFAGFCQQLTNSTSECRFSNNALKGYTYYAGYSATQCRIVTVARCSSEMHRISRERCRQTIRRTWTCDQSKNQIPRNEFNTCYEPPSDYSGSGHPACQSGAPHFAVGDCKTYVGQDFLRSTQAASTTCASFVTDRDAADSIAVPAMTAVTNNDYWCNYDSAWLRIQCHADASKCTAAETARCIKRISELGGCSAIAKTMQCRTLQSQYPFTVDEETLYSEGCAPCIVLPYSSSSSLGCPSNYTTSATQTTDTITLRAQAVGEDFYYGATACSTFIGSTSNTLTPNSSCDKASTCADPPRGTLDWTPSHISGFAVVNTPIILTLEDIPNRSLPLRFIRADNTVNPPVFYLDTTYSYYTYPGTASRDELIRTWPGYDGTALPHGERLAPEDTLATLTGGAECLLRDRPAFQLTAEVLWPDNDAGTATEPGTIKSLFGSDSLDWWTSMGPDNATQAEIVELQRAYSADRGFTHIDGLSDTEAAAELARRAGLSEIVDCNYGSSIWCRWTPKQSGYYRLQATGAWKLRRFGVQQQWIDISSPLLPGRYNGVLDDASFDNVCDSTLIDISGNVVNAAGAAKDPDCVKIFVEQDPPGLNFADFGLQIEADKIKLLDIPSQAPTNLQPGDPEPDEGPSAVFLKHYGNAVQCPPIDLRVDCGGDSSVTVNVTTTEYIGILVYETRTSTRRPSIGGQ